MNTIEQIAIIIFTSFVKSSMKVVLVLSCVWLFPTSWTVAHQALSMGSPRQEYWSGLPFPSPGDHPNPGIEPKFPALAGRFFTAEPARKSRLYGAAAAAKSLQLCLTLCDPKVDIIKQKCFIFSFNMFYSNVCQVTYTQRAPCPLSRLRHTHILVTVSA